MTTGWHTLDTARDQWRDAPSDDDTLQQLLDVARHQVTAYAPTYTGEPGTSTLAAPDPTTGALQPVTAATVPADYRLAQLMQARNIWNAGRVDPASGGLGDDSFIMRPFPLDWMVKQIIRPKRALPWIG